MADLISVITVFDAGTRTLRPYKVQWKGREYKITKLGYYHTVREGRTMLHMYYVSAGNLDFSLECNGDNLHWTLKEVIDGSTL